MRADVGIAVTGSFQFVGDVGVGAQQGHGRLVESGALRFTLRQVFRDFGIAAEIVDVLQLSPGRFHRFAE